MGNPNINGTQNIKVILEKLPGVLSVGNISIKDRIIEFISLENKSIGLLTLKRLKVADADALFDFYFNGLTEKSREFFPPYPLFSPPIGSPEELAGRIKDWQKEDDWTVLNLTKDEQIIGVCLLKRFKTPFPQFGVAVRRDYENLGMAFLLLVIVQEQARLLNLNKLVATAAPDNLASIQMLKWYGFKKTGQSVPHYIYKDSVKVIDRFDVELELEF
jgi:RimJ/RimL family protein N-acetyltransferase